MKKYIIYQTLTRLWGNGRFSAWDDAAFSYLKSLSVDYIWFTGIPRHASGEPFVKGDPGSPYAVCDWYDVNPYLADNPEKRMEEFSDMVARVHKAGLKCLVDYIPNHVARNYKGVLPLYSWCDGDWTDTLKVNWSDPSTEAEEIRILEFWASKGVDGFRCDMVELVPADALGRVIKSIKREYPEMLFVAEVYGQENYTSYLDTAGFDLLYDKSGTYDILRGVFGKHRSAVELSRNWQFLGPNQSKMLNFLENHDEQRLASPHFAGRPDNMWASLAFELLFNDASFMLYAGQEAGEDASESKDGRTSIFNWCRPASLSDIWNSITGTADLPAARKEVFNQYRELLTVACHKVFKYGKVWDLCYCNYNSPGFSKNEHFVFARYDGESCKLVFCNFSQRRASSLVCIPEELRNAAGVSSDEAAIEAPPYGYVLTELK